MNRHVSTTSMDVLNYDNSSTSFNHRSAVSLDENSTYAENKKRNIYVEGQGKTAVENADGGDKKRKRVEGNL